MVDEPLLAAISASASALLSFIDCSKVSERVAAGFIGDGIKSTARGFLTRLQPDARQKTAAVALALFTEEFVKELEDRSVGTIELPVFRRHLAGLLELAAPELAGYVSPDTKHIDLEPVRRIIEHGMEGPDTPRLPPAFNWKLVAENLARSVRTYVRRDPALSSALSLAIAEETADAVSRLAPLDPGFRLAEYRDFLRRKCGTLALSALHASTYDRRILLWSVFVPQNARAAVPVRNLPRELLRQLGSEGQGARSAGVRTLNEEALLRLVETYASEPAVPVLETIRREDFRHSVILGDPGSGKTSLVRYLVLSWVENETGPFPVLIDLKEYTREADRRGILKFTESAPGANFNLRATDLEKLFSSGAASLYLDGLDEIFDPPLRRSVLDELMAFAARYPQAQITVTTRVVGYDADPLRNAGFAHLTLEDFDDSQISEFLHRWHEASEPDSPQERRRLQAQLERARTDSRAIRELSGNPLLLTMMAILNRNQDLPRDRVELYREATRVLLHEWDVRKALPADTFGRQEKEELLRELAGHMQEQHEGLAGNLIERVKLSTIFRDYLKRLGVDDPHTKANELIWLLTERNFILCYAGADRFAFVHRTFLEDYCASWFTDRMEKKGSMNRERLRQVFEVHWPDETWHEVLRLIVGLVHESVAGELIDVLMHEASNRNQLAPLTLAAACLGEVRNRHALAKVDAALFSKMTMELLEPLETVTTNRAIARSRRGMSMLEATGSAKYLARAATTRNAVRVFASTWRTPEAVRWLTSILENFGENERLQVLRLAAADELADRWKDDPDTLDFLVNRAATDKSLSVRRTIQRRLGLDVQN